MHYLLKQFIPPIFRTLYWYSFKYGWKGYYESFEAANKIASGYDEQSILEKIKETTRKVVNGEVTFSEKSSWELLVDTIESRNSNLILNKRFLSCINDKLDIIEFIIFENFMLIKDDNSNLMLSFEQSFDDN